MKLLFGLRRKSSSRNTKKALPVQSDRVSDIHPYVGPPPSLNSSSINLSRCTSLESMDSMAAALALLPEQLGQLDLAANLAQDLDEITVSTHPQSPSPRVAALVSTVGPSQLRSNIRAKPKRVRSSERGLEMKLRDDISKTLGGPHRPSLDLGRIAGSNMRLTATDSGFTTNTSDGASASTSTDTSAASSPYAITPRDLTPTEEVAIIFPTSSTSGHQLPHSLDGPKEEPSPTPSRRCFAPHLPFKSSFSPALIPAASPTGSSFGGDFGSLSPTFSYFHSSDGSRPRRSWGSIFGNDEAMASPSGSGSFQIGSSGVSGSSPTRAVGDMFGAGSVILLVSPTSELYPSTSTFPSRRRTSMRLAECRPIALDLSAASRCPHLTPHSRRTSAPSFPTTQHPTFRQLTPPVTPELGASLSAAQDKLLNTPHTGQLEARNDITLQWVLSTPPDTPPDQPSPLPRLKPIDFPPLPEMNEVREYRKGLRRLSAVVESASP